mmetsp:Transcript_31483/g.97174  ORF Transcript_31483/g.97174 Transcript_31483/m.97174 type:complete len:213 (+) Transcript_31483:733-1371(+)
MHAAYVLATTAIATTAITAAFAPAPSTRRRTTRSASTLQSAATRELLELCGPSNYGAKPVDRARLDELIAELAASSPTERPAWSPRFSGRWRLLWTTETELLFAVDKGLFAAGPCVGVEQTIDVAGGVLENIVLFDNDSRLFVGSTISPDAGDASGKRFDFAFSSCSLTWRGTTVPLPPVGKGWGDLLYLDDDLRVQKDVRGDILIATKATT